MRSNLLFFAALAAVLACGTGRSSPPTDSADAIATSDSAFQAMDHRHGDVVGVDPSALEHEFVLVSGGGDVILGLQTDDEVLISQARIHIGTVADAFRRGDFAIPGFIHDKPAAGTDVMTRKRALITYTVDDIPDGAALRIRSNDPEAVRAIREFIEFQIEEHRTAQ